MIYCVAPATGLRECCGSVEAGRCPAIYYDVPKDLLEISR